MSRCPRCSFELCTCKPWEIPANPKIENPDTLYARIDTLESQLGAATQRLAQLGAVARRHADSIAMELVVKPTSIRGQSLLQVSHRHPALGINWPHISLQMPTEYAKMLSEVIGVMNGLLDQEEGG